MKPVIDTISLVEDKLAELNEEGNLELKIGSDGLPTDKFLDTTEKYAFLKRLSTDLAKFHAGRY